ncbi:MAG: hypothetical protein AAF597_12445, partial [Bacteroidota bacterium]
MWIFALVVVSCGMDNKSLKAENQRLVEENEALAEKHSALEKEHAQLREKLAILEFQLRQFQQLIFSSRRERYLPIPANEEQLRFDFGELAPVDLEASATPEAQTTKVTYERRKQKHPGRITLPEHLPVEEITIQPDDLPADAEHVADTIVETLDYQPGRVWKKKYIFPRYLKTEKQEQDTERTAFFQAKMPSRPLPKSIAEAGLLSYLITQKFVYHQPFYRQ